jgi:uroporphyrinogen-III synthase
MSRFVLITRHPADCGELQALLDGSDIKLRPYPVLRLEDVEDDRGLADAVAAVSPSDTPAWLVFASPRAPERFARACRRGGAEHLLDLPIAVVGSGTARAVAKAGLESCLVGPGTGFGLADKMIEELAPGAPVVFACGRDRRPELPARLAAAGHPVLPVVVYRMEATPPRELPPLGPSLEAVVLTSPRAASLYLEGVGGRPLPCPHLALGPTTRDAAAALGIDCRAPAEPTLESLAEELCTI